MRSDVAEEFEKAAGGESAEVLEVFDHVCLVVIAELMSEIEP